MTDSFEKGRKNVEQFIKENGSVGESVLKVFNTYDFLQLDPNRGEVPVDEYLHYVQEFMKLFSCADEHQKTEADIAIMLFKCFSPEQFLGIGDVCKLVEENKVEPVYRTLGERSEITTEDIVDLAKLIFFEMKKLNIKVVIQNT